MHALRRAAAAALLFAFPALAADDDPPVQGDVKAIQDQAAWAGQMTGASPSMTAAGTYMVGGGVTGNNAFGTNPVVPRVEPGAQTEPDPAPQRTRRWHRMPQGDVPARVEPAATDRPVEPAVVPKDKPAEIPGATPDAPTAEPLGDVPGARAAGDLETVPVTGAGRRALETDAAELEAKKAAAMGRAGRMAEQLKAAMGNPGSVPPGGAAGGFPGAATSPAGPAPEADMLAAAHSGYAPTYAALGLHPGSDAGGRPALVDSSGRPASPAALAALREKLALEPRALARRPDFFTVIARPDYERVKSERGASGAGTRPEFKDVGFSEQRRDLIWNRTCAEISGDCNRYAAERSYRTNQELAPETVKNIAEKTEAQDAAEVEAYLKSKREARAKTGAAGGLAALLRGAKRSPLMRSLARILGFKGAKNAVSAAGSVPPPSGSALAASVEGGSPPLWTGRAGGRARATEADAFGESDDESPAEKKGFPWGRVLSFGFGAAALAGAYVLRERARAVRRGPVRIDGPDNAAP